MFENINPIRHKHLEFFFNFLLRPGMFIGEYSDEKFMNYIYGYKLGSETGFINRFSNYITEKHAIQFKGRGLKQQIETLAKNENKEWITCFANECFALIFELVAEKNKSDFQHFIKRRVKFLIEQQENSNINLIFHWKITVHTKSKWFLEIFNKDELQEIENVESIY